MLAVSWRPILKLSKVKITSCFSWPGDLKHIKGHKLNRKNPKNMDTQKFAVITLKSKQDGLP